MSHDPDPMERPAPEVTSEVGDRTKAAHLRPVERRVLHWAACGLDDHEIGLRFKRSAHWAARVQRFAGIDRLPAPARRVDPLRPIERCLLRWRDGGTGHDELSGRFHRSAPFLERVEGYARYKLTDRGNAQVGASVPRPGSAFSPAAPAHPDTSEGIS